jgi:hypothetical protein
VLAAHQKVKVKHNNHDSNSDYEDDNDKNDDETQITWEKWKMAWKQNGD